MGPDNIGPDSEEGCKRLNKRGTSASAVARKNKGLGKTYRRDENCGLSRNRAVLNTKETASEKGHSSKVQHLIGKRGRKSGQREESHFRLRLNRSWGEAKKR